MKKLLVCVAILAIAATVAHFVSDVAVLKADDLAGRAVVALEQYLRDADVNWSPDGLVREGLLHFLRPGAYAISRVGIDPATTAGLSLAGFIGWWLWITAARFIWCAVARIFGVADMAHFWIWLLAVPPWRPFYRVWLLVKRWWKTFFIHQGASASWTGFLATLTLVYVPGDCVPLGRPLLCGIRLFQQIGLRGVLHLLMIAASGAGKTRWATNFICRLPKEASALVVDCDAQLVNAAGDPLERQGHVVVNVDPFGQSRFPRKGRWNAMDELDHAVRRHGGREAVVRYSQTISDSLVVDENEMQKIFATVARQFLHALILFVWLFEPKERRNLVRVRELAEAGMPERVIDPKQDAFAVLLHVMKEANSFDDECSGAITAVIVRGASLMESGQRVRDGNPFRASLVAATAWLALPEMATISQASDFACEDLKLGNTCVFISAPVIDVQTKLSGWVRVLTMTTWYVFANIPKRLHIPSAWIIDEFPSLRIPSLDVAAPVARKHGIRLLLIAQDLEKMAQAYPKSYKGFGGNSMATIWMGTDHPDNYNDLSEYLGSCMRKEKIEGGWFSKVPARYQLVERKLAQPHQLRELLDPTRGWIVVTRFGKPPLLLALEQPEKALPIWKLNADPAFGEKFLRAFARAVLTWLRPRK